MCGKLKDFLMKISKSLKLWFVLFHNLLWFSIKGYRENWICFEFSPSVVNRQISLNSRCVMEQNEFYIFSFVLIWVLKKWVLISTAFDAPLYFPRQEAVCVLRFRVLSDVFVLAKVDEVLVWGWFVGAHKLTIWDEREIPRSALRRFAIFQLNP